MNQIESLKNEITSLKTQYKFNLEQLQRDYEQRNYEMELAFQEQLEELERERDQFEQNWRDSEHANKNLYRITRERTNQDQDLHPVKKHTAYVLLTSEEYIYHYKVSKKEIIPYYCWKVRIQTPYPVDLDVKTMKLSFKKDIKEVIGSKMGIQLLCEINEISSEDFFDFWNTGKRLLFHSTYKRNYIKRLWEVEFLVNHSFLAPDDMMATPKG